MRLLIAILFLWPPADTVDTKRVKKVDTNKIVKQTEMLNIHVEQLDTKMDSLLLILKNDTI